MELLAGRAMREEVTCKRSWGNGEHQDGLFWHWSSKVSFLGEKKQRLTQGNVLFLRQNSVLLLRLRLKTGSTSAIAGATDVNENMNRL